MLALKKSFVNLQVHFALKRANKQRDTVPYNKTKEVGIIFSAGDVYKHESVKRFVKILEKDGKRVDVLSFLLKDQENHEFLFDFFREEDVSLWGQFKSKNTISFMNKEFDYLFHLDLEPNPHIEHVLAKCSAKCRIGSFKEHKYDFYEMMVKTNTNSIDELIKQFYYYSKSLI